MEYIPTIGLEIHVELKTSSKMFCSCVNNPDESHPNVNICPTCMGHPGTLPVINKEAVKKVIKAGLALNCEISDYSKFDRKNYFYPDLPKGYQISQYDMPISKNGFLELNGDKIRIRRIHLEEDTGKLVHPKGKNYSLVDFNRAGVPLMELVTEPDLKTSEQARKFAEELRVIFRYIGISEANMEKGEMRVEANISLAKQGEKKGTKVEVKNLNSFRAVEKALEYEMERQKELLKEADKITQQTRGWDDKKQITVSQREKESAHDYRYFPEPDLPGIYLGDKKLIQEIKSEIPELPQQKRERFKEQYGLSLKETEIFFSNKGLSDYFEKVVSEFKNWIKIEKRELEDKDIPKIIELAKNYITTDLQGLLKETSINGESFLITPENFAELMNLIYTDKISSKIAKKVLREMFSTGKDPSQIIEDKNLTQIKDESKIEEIVDKIISENPGPVKDYKRGKNEAIQFLVGQVMKETKGKADPGKVNQTLKDKLNS